MLTSINPLNYVELCFILFIAFRMNKKFLFSIPRFKISPSPVFKSTKSLDEIPGPRPLPFVGNMMNMKTYGKRLFLNHNFFTPIFESIKKEANLTISHSENFKFSSTQNTAM